MGFKSSLPKVLKMPVNSMVSRFHVQLAAQDVVVFVGFRKSMSLPAGFVIGRFEYPLNDSTVASSKGYNGNILSSGELRIFKVFIAVRIALIKTRNRLIPLAVRDKIDYSC